MILFNSRSFEWIVLTYIKLKSKYATDVEECSKRGIQVGNTPGCLDETTADLVVGLLLATARRIPEVLWEREREKKRERKRKQIVLSRSYMWRVCETKNIESFRQSLQWEMENGNQIGDLYRTHTLFFNIKYALSLNSIASHHREIKYRSGCAELMFMRAQLALLD
jgi:hypothetical protein